MRNFVRAVVDQVKAGAAKHEKAARIKEDTAKGELLWEQTVADYKAGRIRILWDRFPKHENAVVAGAWHRAFLRALNAQQPKRVMPVAPK